MVTPRDSWKWMCGWLNREAWDPSVKREGHYGLLHALDSEKDILEIRKGKKREKSLGLKDYELGVKSWHTKCGSNIEIS